MFLTAGQLIGGLVEQVRDGEYASGPVDTLGDLCRWAFGQFERVADIGAHAQMRVKCKALRDITHRALSSALVGDVDAVERHGASVSRFETNQQPQKHGFARARRPAHDGEAALLDLQVEPVQHGVGAIGLGEAGKRNRH